MGKALQKPFYIEDYISETTGTVRSSKVIDITKDKQTRFNEICKAIYDYFMAEWNKENNTKNDSIDIILERANKAIIGYEQEVKFFKDQIFEYLKANNLLNEWYPSWYISLTDAIFHENWGLAGIAEWKFSEKYAFSSSAKIIGNRIYFMEDGEMKLQRQTISKERRKQLRKALLLRTPKLRPDKNYAEVYMLDNTRITIYGEGLTKEDQDAIVFRKYVIPQLTFEEQAKRHTIPAEIINMLKAMVKCGFNVAFTGAVRTAKTTFLQTWQKYEDPTLEGLQIETDPEIPAHLISPTAPIIQLVADGEDLDGIVKSVLRSDADYIIMGEARDGVALNIAVKIANKGTRRVKITFHTTDLIDFCYDVADEIIKVYGGSLYSTIIKVAKSFNYVFQFIQLKDKSQKRLKAIYEIRYNPENHQISIHQICKYRYKTDDWVFKYDVGPNIKDIGIEEHEEYFNIFDNELKRLAEKYPMEGNNVYIPSYDHLRGHKNSV